MCVTRADAHTCFYILDASGCKPAGLGLPTGTLWGAPRAGAGGARGAGGGSERRALRGGGPGDWGLGD